MPKDGEEEVIELVEEKPVEGADDEQAEVAEEGELVVQIGDEEPESGEDEEGGTPLVRKLRQLARDKDKRIKELEASVAPKTQATEKPTLADCDYDNAVYEERLLEWNEGERERKAAEASAEEARKKQDARWQQRLATYDEGKTKLGVKDYDEAEDMVRDILQPGFNGMGPVEDLRLNIIKQGAKDPNLVIYALGKNTKKAKELAEIEDPVEYAMAIGRLEGELKVTRKARTQPEKAGIEGAGTGAGSVDNALERLRAEAAESGDYTKVTAYKRKLKEAA